jgi:hypothetical protein
MLAVILFSEDNIIHDSSCAAAYNTLVTSPHRGEDVIPEV